MKSYVTDKQLRLVGKGWEIREWLRRQRRAAGANVMMSELLGRQLAYGASDAKRHGLKVV